MESIVALLTPPGAVPGTGLRKVMKIASEKWGPGAITPQLLHAAIASMPGIFGDYPNASDIAPCAIFISVFSILALAHLFVFLKNRSRGQNFWISFGLMCYCLLRVIGFALRIQWAKDSLLFNVGIASVVFSHVPPLYLNVLCMILGHRIFTWRHPETGNSVYFNFSIIHIYVLSAPLVSMAILGQVIPNLYFLGEAHLRICHQVTQAAAVLNLLYAMSGMFLILLAYLFKPGTIDHRMWRMPKSKECDVQDLPPVVQPTWIKSTALTYYPCKGEQTRIDKNGPLGKAIRIIPSREVPAGGLCRVVSNDGCSNHKPPSIKTAIYIVIVVSSILAMNIAFRTASTFVLKPRGVPISSWLYNNYVYYIWYGGFEAIVNVILLLTRIDLRFYIPDMAKSTGASDAPVEAEQEKQNVTVVEYVSFDNKC